MSKEVIIDGVNVAGCEFYNNKYCKLCDMRSALDELIVRRQYCNKTVNNACYYKQLKRLEQENAKLKEKLQQIKNAILYCGETDFCNICKFADKCNGYVEEAILQIIGGAEDE